MKIAHAQLHMYANIMYKFQSSTCKTVGEKLQTKLCPQTDGRTAMAVPVYHNVFCLLNQRYQIMCQIYFAFSKCFKFGLVINFWVPHGSVAKCLTRNPGDLDSSRTGSSGLFCGNFLGQDTSEPILVLMKPRKA